MGGWNPSTYYMSVVQKENTNAFILSQHLFMLHRLWKFYRSQLSCSLLKSKMQNNSGSGGVELLPSMYEVLRAFPSGREKLRLLTYCVHNLKPATVWWKGSWKVNRVLCVKQCLRRSKTFEEYDRVAMIFMVLEKTSTSYFVRSYDCLENQAFWVEVNFTG